VTERVKLWDNYTDRINQHTVKMSFMKKVHRRNPPFRLKIRHPRRKAAQVCQSSSIIPKIKLVLMVA